MGRLGPKAAPKRATMRNKGGNKGLITHLSPLLLQNRSPHCISRGAHEYWDGYNRHGRYSDKDSLAPYEAFIEPMTDLFDQTQAAFESSKGQAGLV